MRFQEQGVSRASIESDLRNLKAEDADWSAGRVPLYVFKGSDEASEAGRAGFLEYFNENALGATRAFKSLLRLEDDVVSMGLELLRAPPSAVGNMTSGGSESIFMAVRAARERARQRRGTSTFTGNIVLPESAHPAFSKAAAVMSFEERRIPVAGDYRADVAAMAAAIDADTFMVAGSAPCFPYGVIDPIAELGEISSKADVWLHVDACIGGYIAPFVADIGYPVPAFDLGVDGVCSLSADLHKFGYAPKPASTVFYRTRELAEHQVFDLDVWPSGRFVTKTLVGTRPGGAVAGAWATMKVLGRSGYREIARQLMGARDAYLADLASRAGYHTLGSPHLTVVAFSRPDVDIFRVANLMSSRRWVPGLVRKPPALHVMMSMLHVPSQRRFVDDLCEATAQALAAPAAAEDDTVAY